jgi:hypothetical protein
MLFHNCTHGVGDGALYKTAKKNLYLIPYIVRCLHRSGEVAEMILDILRLYDY